MEAVRVDVLIITALKDELDAVLESAPGSQGLDEWERRTDRHGFPYYVRDLDNAQGELLRVAAAWSGEMGEAAAATRAVALIEALNPACLAMCGICAGKRGDTSLGDVILADRVYSYDHGKLIAGEGISAELFHDIETYNLDKRWAMNARDFASEFQRSWEGQKQRPPSKESQRRWLLHTLHAQEKESAPPPEKHPERKSRCPGWKRCLAELREAGLIETTPGRLALTQAGLDWLAEDQLQHPDGPEDDPRFRVHVGPIATGKTVREDPALFDRLKRHVRKTLGAEMEAAAIGAVAQTLGRRSIIVKSVSDHADQDKDDAYRSFACRASAEFLLAFLSRYMGPSEDGAKHSRAEAEEGHTGSTHYEFLERVKKVCTLKWTHPGTTLQARPAPVPFGRVLEVSTTEDRIHALFPVAALDQDISAEGLAAFETGVLAPYRRRSPGGRAYLIHTGRSAPEPLALKARSKQINLYSFEEFQGLIDFSSYVEQQTTRLRNDNIYLPEHYVEQRAQVLVHGQTHERVEGVLSMVQGLLSSPDPRFLVVLGEFGTGKTFLLHELARRMGQENSGLVPVLLEMRALQKALDLRALLAQHFAVSALRHFNLDSFFYMLREGRIALLFDGFDELALRVTYEQVMEHFGTLTEAAQERAKVVITSRTQHFLTDHDVKRELARRAEALPGYRILKLERFREDQIHRFLVKRLGSESAASKRLKLLHDVKDLLGLSENPRLLSFIVELDPEKLEEARAGSGEITSSKLYALLVDKWLRGEHERVNPKGAPKGLSVQQLRNGATDLALLLWGKTERTVEMSDLPAALIASVNAQGAHPLEPSVIRHQLGSGSLLVRDEDGRFSFIHQSIMEWLVAVAAAAEFQRFRGSTAILDRGEMSELMADFFISLVGKEPALAWAAERAASEGNDISKKNALRIMGRLRGTAPGLKQSVQPRPAKNFEGSDLRGQDLSGNDLSGANFQKADLSGTTLIKADLTQARLQDARLVRADLEGAVLKGAELKGANLTRARLLGTDLRGAALQGARLRAAKLIGAKVDSLDGCDVSGAALPATTSLAPTLLTGSPGFAVAFSPTDDLIATGHANGTVCLWDAVTGKALRLLDGHAEPVTSVAFSPTGATLASGSDDRTITLWSVSQGEPLHRLKGHTAQVRSVAFSPDGSTLASASDDQTVALWNVLSGACLHRLEGHTDSVWGVAFSPDGSTLASASRDRTVALWSVAQRALLHRLEGHTASVRGVAFSPDGSTLASASHDQTITLWNVRRRELMHRLEGHTDSVRSVAFSPDGDTLASASDDRTIALWSVIRGSRLLRLERHSDSVWSVAFSPDGSTLASTSYDQTVALWSVPRRERLRALKGHSAPVRNVAFSPDGSTLASASDNRTIALWSVAQGEQLRRLEGHTASVRSVAFSPDGTTLASGSDDRTIALWNVSRGELLGQLEGDLAPAWGVAFSPDGATLASASRDKTVSLWSVPRKVRLHRLRGHTSAVRSVAFSPDGATLASASDDRTIALWDTGRGERLQVLEEHQDSVLSVAFSPDGTTLASASHDRSIALWSVARGAQLWMAQGHMSSVRSVAFSPDGSTLASTSDDQSIMLWSVTRGERLHRLEGHTDSVRSVSFSPDGAMLCSASDDGTVCLWDATTGHQLLTLFALPEGWVAFRPDGTYKSQGSMSGAFWHTSGLCRFEMGELDGYLPLRIPEGIPMLPATRPHGR